MSEPFHKQSLLESENPLPMILEEDLRLQISAFMDGELDAPTAQTLLDTLLRNDSSGKLLRKAWQEYHVLQEGLSSSVTLEQVHPTRQADFVDAITRRLAHEPYHLRSPKQASQKNKLRASMAGRNLTLAATLVAVTWVIWPMLDNHTAGVTRPTTAQQMLAQPTNQTLIYKDNLVDLSLSPYLQAHQQTVGWSRIHAAPVVMRVLEEPVDARHIQ